MTLNRHNTRTFHRRLYSGQLQSITLLKRNDDQQQGIVTSFILYQCRRSSLHKTGESIQGDMSAGDSTYWHIPRTELDRVGINYLNPLDRIVDPTPKTGGIWMPQANTHIDVKLFGTHITILCTRLK